MLGREQPHYNRRSPADYFEAVIFRNIGQPRASLPRSQPAVTRTLHARFRFSRCVSLVKDRTRSASIFSYFRSCSRSATANDPRSFAAVSSRDCWYIHLWNAEISLTFANQSLYFSAREIYGRNLQHAVFYRFVKRFLVSGIEKGKDTKVGEIFLFINLQVTPDVRNL